MYIYFVLPWWLRNKLAVTNDVDPVNFFPLLTRDGRLLRLVREHTCLRRSSVEDKTRGQPYDASVRELSLFGAAIVTQYFLFRGDLDRYTDDHEYVSAAVHVMDDYADRHEDLEAGNVNYFNDTPNPVPIEEWIRGLYKVHARHAGAPFGKYIRGSMCVVGLFHKSIREIMQHLDEEAKLQEMPQISYA